MAESKKATVKRMYLQAVEDGRDEEAGAIEAVVALLDPPLAREMKSRGSTDSSMDMTADPDKAYAEFCRLAGVEGWS